MFSSDQKLPGPSKPTPWPETHDMSSISGRVRDLASLQDGQLGLDPLGLLGIGRDDVQSTDTFVVQPGVLGKRLRGRRFVSPDPVRFV